MMSLIFRILLSGVFIAFVGVGVLCSTTPLATGAGFFFLLGTLSFLIDAAHNRVLTYVPEGENMAVWHATLLRNLNIISRACMAATVSLGLYGVYIIWSRFGLQ